MRLAGKWLEACGFEVGRFIHIRPLNKHHRNHLAGRTCIGVF
ncbi:hypothetical protein [Chryseolinea soli]|uniref:Type I addiction module toxin, SymE family n=1 Tax=Chryseolinea soli TaxID=2321403 RepID=A0A385SWS6_9BACT|nr:hypothetical protein D4L85_31060 [Chryseolinea soli]